jgi:hypothetical protein
MTRACRKVLVIGLMAMLLLVSTAGATKVGVEVGDWMEYDYVYETEPVVNHTLSIRIDILSVQILTVDVKTTIDYSNGTQDIKTILYDFETGAGNLFVIPAGLKEGDKFYHEIWGNITITKEESMEVLGAERTVISTRVDGMMPARWDQEKGILVFWDIATDSGSFIIKAVDTNIWEEEDVLPNLWYTLVGLAIIIILFAVLAAVLRGRNNKNRGGGKKKEKDSGPPDLEGVRI